MIDGLRNFYRTPAFRYTFWALLIILLILANWALMTQSDLLLFLVSAVGILFSAVGIYIERLNFKSGDTDEPTYTTRVIRQVALLAVSLGLAVLALVLVSGLLN